MNKAFFKKAESASRKHEKKGGSNNKHSFMDGVDFCSKNSPNKFNEKEMFQAVYDGIGFFAHKNDIKINGKELNSWFKKYIKVQKK
jgi:hypothetical protein